MNTKRKTLILTALMAAMSLPAAAAVTNTGCYVYMAAGLFSASQIDFNAKLEASLDKSKYKTFLPQRDGFVFLKLQQALEKVLPSEQVLPAVETIIYYLDVGYFIPKSNLVIGLMDEPLDPGVIIEMANARYMDKYEIQYKTDILSPFGTYSDPLGGIHFFPPFSSNVFMLNATFDTLVNRLSIRMKEGIDKQMAANPQYTCDQNAYNFVNADIKKNPVLIDLMKGSNALFDKILVDNKGKLLPSGSQNLPANYQKLIDAIHTDAGLAKVAQNYKDSIALDPNFFKVFPVIDTDR